MAINKGEGYEGYVIPIKAVLKCVQIEQPLSTASPTKSTEILLVEGNRHLLKNESELAIHQYDEIINDRNYISALNNKGKALEKLNKHAEAIECYRQAKNIGSHTSLSW